MENNKEEYNDKAYNIFNLLNQFRANPRQLAHHLEKLKKYLDKSTNVLSQPDKVQFQMIEGEKVIDEAIKFLKNLPPIPPLEWEEALTKSAQQHVDDIGPKGILSYQSSDGTEPEDRITKYGNYMDALGENIDFGPNDEIGVIVSMTLDDGEIERPHRENLFNNDFKKIGIACGPHKTEFQMCVMDFAAEFFPNKQAVNNKNIDENNYLDNIQNNYIDVTENQNAYNMLKNSLLVSKEINMNASGNYNINNSNNNISNNIDNDIKNLKENLKKEINRDENNNDNILNNNNIKTISSKNNISKNNSNDNNIINNNNIFNNNNLKNNPPNNNSANNNDINKDALNNNDLINNILKINKISDIEKMKQKVKEINSNKKIVQKKIEIFTTITYKLEDGSIRTVNEVKTHINKF